MSPEASTRRAPGVAMISPPTGLTARRTSIEERERVVADSLNVGNPTNNAKDLLQAADANFERQLELAVDEIQPYERNPRRANNAKFDEIKESIRASGIRNPLTVTQRPGERHFIVETGGNTRLMAIQQLWAETKTARFQKIRVMYRPWRSESHVLTAHLVENDQRGELTFWDKSYGLMALKGQLESERGRTLSLRQFEEKLQELGMSVDKSSLSRHQFAAIRLQQLGEALSKLSVGDVKIIQPRLNLLSRYAERRGRTEADLYAQVFDPVFQRQGTRYAQTQGFEADRLCQECEQALAEHFQEAVARLRMHLDALAKSPDPTREGLEGKAPNSPTPIPPTRVETASAASRISPSVPRGDSSEGIVANPTHGASRGRPSVAHTEDNVGSEPLDVATPSIALPLRDSSASERLQHLKHCVTEFARLTAVSDCLAFCATLPCGYYMELPPSPLDLQSDKPFRHRAWWLLALLSGQMDDALILQMPKGSRWRRARKGDRSNDLTISLLIENDLGGLVYFDAELAKWLLDPTDERATLFWELVLHVRELKLAMPQNFATGTKCQASKQEE